MSITNTSKQRPELHILDAMMVGSSQAIKASERRGAMEMASQTTQLPTEGSENPAWARMGVVYDAPVARHEGHYVVRSLGNAGFVRFAVEHQGYAKVVGDAPDPAPWDVTAIL